MIYEFPKNALLSMVKVVDNTSLYDSKADIASMVIRDMHQHLTHEIIRTTLTQENKCFSTVFRMEALVLKPDEFAGLVQREALRLHCQMNLHAVKG